MTPTSIVLLISTLFCCDAWALNGTPQSAVTERILNVCTDFEKHGRFSGSVYVKTNNSVEYDDAFGFTTLTSNIPNTPETAFRIGAITRFFTTAEILKLASNGLLHLDDPVQKYIEEFNRPGTEKISLHHLLSNSSGIPDYMPTWKTAWNMKFGSSEPPPDGFDGVLREILPLTPTFAPGTKGESSNSNFMLLGKVIEKVEATPFHLIMRRILAETNLTQTGFSIDSEVPASTRSIGSTALSPLDPRSWFGRSRRIQKEFRHPEWDLASGSLYSTTRNIAKWIEALQNNRVIPEHWRNKIFTKYVQKNTNQWFAYGGEIQQVNGKDVFFLTGAHPGYQSIAIVVPETKTTIIILSNFGDSPPSRSRFFREIVAASVK